MLWSKSCSFMDFVMPLKSAFASVVYLRMTNSKDKVHVSLVLGKTKVAPIKQLTIPRLELCRPHLLAKVLHHVKRVLEIPSWWVFGWTDSTIVLDWLKGNRQKFKRFVSNRISVIMDPILSEKWNNVNGVDNPGDCASRTSSSELVTHKMLVKNCLRLNGQRETVIMIRRMKTALKKCVTIQLVKCYHLSSHWIIILIFTVWSELQHGWFLSSIIVERRVPL